MIKQTLREARRYEEASGKMIREEERPAFHLSARTGWMNDPNGFSFYKGQYHMFYQYYPYDSHWSFMHWGHAVSDNLLHWEYYPAVLAPDESYDRDGCFSGSAVTLPDGRQLLMYTGVVEEYLQNGTKKTTQTQCLAVGDGVDYEKVSNNPVLTVKDLPEGGSASDFRDPKMWRKKDGTYCCVAGNQSADGSGQILLFTSPDGFSWSFKKVLVSNHNRLGKMWECPDFFELDGKGVLLVSPQDMLPQGFEYHNGNGTVCMIGNYDEETDTFMEEYDQAIDYGIDFYAPQTVLTEDGRRIMIGWMQNWDTCNLHAQERPWFGQMSLPRELSVRNGRLFQQPVRELMALRSGKVEHSNISVSGIAVLEGVHGRRVDMELTIRPEKGRDVYQKFAVRFAQDEDCQTSISFRPHEGVVKVDRKFSGSRRAIIHQRRCLVNDPKCRKGELKIRLILDRFSVEAFINDGEQVMTATFYTNQEADGISFFADGTANIDVVKYDLK